MGFEAVEPDVSEGTASSTSSTESFMDKVKALWAKKEVKIGVAIAIVALVAIILFCGGESTGGASSPEGAAENFLGATMDCDAERMIKCMPPQVSGKMIEMLNSMGMGISAMEQQMRREIPDDMSYKIIGKERMDKDEIEYYKSEISSLARQIGAGNVEVKIEDVYYVEAELLADGNASNTDISAGKIGRLWYILDLDM